jgi:hypothetical protein
MKFTSVTSACSSEGPVTAGTSERDAIRHYPNRIAKLGLPVQLVAKGINQ